MNRTRVTRGLAAALLLAAGMSGLGGATPFGTIPSALAAYPVSFAPQAIYAVGSSPQDVAIGDFNGDGHPDLAVTNSGANTVSVLLGKADGTFGAQTTYAVGSGPTAVAIGDFNGDGHPDLAVTNASSTTVYVLLGKGDGTFGAQTAYGVGSRPEGVAIGDFNGDGHPDLAVTNSSSGTVSVLLSRANPTAASVSRFRVSHRGHGLLFHWRLASASGIVGFRLLAQGRRVTSHLIPVHANQVYRVTVRTSPAGPYTLRVLFSSGRTATVHLLGPR